MNLFFVLIFMLPIDDSHAGDQVKYEIINEVMISKDPQSKTVTNNEPVTFEVVALGADSYQWQKDGMNIPGATRSSYTIDAVKSSDSGTYRVVVTSEVGSKISNGAVLKIKKHR